MTTIENKTENCKLWRKAQIKLKKFNKIIKLVEEYPPKLMKFPPSPLYELNK